MPKEFIVAIELGSSKMTGIAGQKNMDGSITVLAVVEEDSTSCINKGVIYNIEKTGQCLTNIVTRLKTILQQDITKVYVGVGGQSIRSVKNKITKILPDNTIVSDEMVNELADANRNMNYPDQEIVMSTPLEWKLDTQFQTDPVGVQCKQLEGNFLNFLWRKKFFNSINTCFDNAGIPIAELFLASQALAESTLTESEKRAGCMLVDLGADTTTVSVYYKNFLRHLAVIPLGSNNITRDIASLQMEEKTAEAMKLKYGSAYTDNKEIDNTLNYPIDEERQVESRKFIEIVEARIEEIIENAWFQVPGEYADKLLGGIILTGGGSNMKNIDVAFRNHTHVDKVRVASFVTYNVTSKDAKINSHDGTMNTILGLLAKGDMNCAGEELSKTLFVGNEAKPAATTADLHRTPRNPNEIKDGVVLTAAEKAKAEEEARRKKEEEEERIRQAEEEERKRIAKEKKENSFFNKAFRKIKQFGKEMISEDE